MSLFPTTSVSRRTLRSRVRSSPLLRCGGGGDAGRPSLEISQRERRHFRIVSRALSGSRRIGGPRLYTCLFERLPAFALGYISAVGGGGGGGESTWESGESREWHSIGSAIGSAKFVASRNARASERCQSRLTSSVGGREKRDNYSAFVVAAAGSRFCWWWRDDARRLEAR